MLLTAISFTKQAIVALVQPILFLSQYSMNLNRAINKLCKELLYWLCSSQCQVSVSLIWDQCNTEQLRALRTLRDNTEKTAENIQRTWERTQERRPERMGRENNQRTLAERTFTYSPTGQIFHGNKHQSVQSLFWPKYIRRLPILEESWWNIC